MPTVPTWGTGQVRPSALPDPTVHVNYSGTHGEAVGEGLQQFGQGLTSYAKREKAKYEDARFNSLEKQMSDWEFKNVDDESNPEAAKAKKADQYTPEVTDRVIEDYNSFTNDLRESLTEEDQRRRFEELYNRRFTALRSRLVDHEVKQADVVSDQAYESGLTIAIRDGVSAPNDTLRVKAYEAGLEKLEKKSQKDGWTEAHKKTELMNYSTRFHSAVVESFVREQPERANKYLEAHAGEINPDKLGDLRRMVFGPALQQRTRLIASDIQYRMGMKSYEAQNEEAALMLSEGQLSALEYKEVKTWLDSDRSSRIQAENVVDNEHLDTMLNMVRERAMKNAPILLSENEFHFGRLSDGSKAKVRALVMEIQNQRRAAGSAERTAQRESNRQSLQEFRERPLRERASFGQRPEDIDIEYLGRADAPTRRILFAMARDAKTTVERGLELQDDEFMRQVKSAALDMFPTDKEKRDAAVNRLIVWRAQWRQRKENEGKEPRQQDLNEAMAWAFLYGEVDEGWDIWPDPNKYGFEVEPGEEQYFVPFDMEGQPYLPNRSQTPSPLGALVPSLTQKQTSKPLVVSPGFVLVMDEQGHFGQVKEEDLDAVLKKNPTWKRAQ